MVLRPQKSSRILSDTVIPFDRECWFRAACRDVLDHRSGKEVTEMFIEMAAYFDTDFSRPRKVRFPLSPLEARRFVREFADLKDTVTARAARASAANPIEHGMFPFQRFYFGWELRDCAIHRTLLSVSTESLGSADLSVNGPEALEDLNAAMQALSECRVRPSGFRIHDRILDAVVCDFFSPLRPA